MEKHYFMLISLLDRLTSERPLFVLLNNMMLLVILNNNEITLFVLLSLLTKPHLSCLKLRAKMP